MSKRLVTYGLFFILAASGASAGQAQKEYLSDLATSRMILSVLQRGEVSGSLEYWTQCGVRQVLPRLLAIRPLHDNPEGSPVPTLQEMFVDDPRMHVTEDSDGMVRMVESDAPEDLLNVTISHISFPAVYDGERAQGFILRAPEVKSFMKTHGIAWLPIGSSLGLFTLPSPEMPHISGDLNNVTLRQALDYVLKTFPGFWVYENCSDKPHNRVGIHFFDYVRQRTRGPDR